MTAALLLRRGGRRLRSWAIPTRPAAVRRAVSRGDIFRKTGAQRRNGLIRISRLQLLARKRLVREVAQHRILRFVQHVMVDRDHFSFASGHGVQAAQLFQIVNRSEPRTTRRLEAITVRRLAVALHGRRRGRVLRTGGRHGKRHERGKCRSEKSLLHDLDSIGSASARQCADPFIR